jgi:hypothetical protein
VNKIKTKIVNPDRVDELTSDLNLVTDVNNNISDLTQKYKVKSISDLINLEKQIRKELGRERDRREIINYFGSL